MEHLKLDKPIEIKLNRNAHIDVCDVVHHAPSGENWVVACVDGDRLYWVGYPFGGSAALSDCQLVAKASAEDRQKLLVKLSELTGFELPILRARARLTKRVPDVAERAVTESGLYNCQVCGLEKCRQPGICDDCLTPPTEDEVKSWGVA